MDAARLYAAGRRAAGYIRTSSLTNCGFLKDTEARQREAIVACAAHFTMDLEAVDGEDAPFFSDPGVQGSDDVHTRPGFMRLLEYCDRTGVRDIVFEDASRLARDLITQEVAFNSLTKAGFRLYNASSPNTFLEDGPTPKLIRCILGAVGEFERSTIVKRLLVARQRAADAKFTKGVKYTLADKPKAVGRHDLLQRWPGLIPILEHYKDMPELDKHAVRTVRDLAFAKDIKSVAGKCLTNKQIRVAFTRVVQKRVVHAHQELDAGLLPGH